MERIVIERMDGGYYRVWGESKMTGPLYVKRCAGRCGTQEEVLETVKKLFHMYWPKEIQEVQEEPALVKHIKTSAEI